MGGEGPRPQSLPGGRGTGPRVPAAGRPLPESAGRRGPWVAFPYPLWPGPRSAESASGTFRSAWARQGCLCPRPELPGSPGTGSQLSGAGVRVQGRGADAQRASRSPPLLLAFPTHFPRAGTRDRGRGSASKRRSVGAAPNKQFCNPPVCVSRSSRHPRSPGGCLLSSRGTRGAPWSGSWTSCLCSAPC